MKIFKTLNLFTLCLVFGLSLVAISCGGGGRLDLPGSLSSEEGPGAIEELQESSLDMPFLTQTIGSVEDYSSGKCLMNYVPDEINIIGSVLISDAKDLAFILGLDDLGDEVRDIIDRGADNMQEVVVFASDVDVSGWAALVRPNEGIVMDEFVSGYLVELMNLLNSSGENEMSHAVIDERTVVFSSLESLVAGVVAKAESTEIPETCLFYRVDKCAALTERPMLYVLIKGRTTLLDLLSGFISDELMNEIRKSMAVLGLDRKEGVIRFYMAMLDSVVVEEANVIESFFIYLDTDNPLIRLLLEEASGSLIEGYVGGLTAQ